MTRLFNPYRENQSSELINPEEVLIHFRIILIAAGKILADLSV